MSSSTQTLHEKIEAQHVIIERLRADNRTITDSAVKLLDRVEELKEENRALNLRIRALLAGISELKDQLAGRALDRDGEVIKP